MEIKYREPTESDIDQILTLFRDNDPSRKDFFNRSYYEWQFKLKPGQSKLQVAEIQGRVGGFFALLPFNASIKGENCTAIQGVEAVVSPEFRGKGIFTNLASNLYGQVQNTNIFNFPRPITFRVYTQRMRHEFIGVLPYWIGITNIKSLFQNKLGPLSTLLSPFNPVLNLRSYKENADNTIVAIKEFDSKWNVVEPWSYKSEFYLIKSDLYLNWRYVKHPCQHYDIYGAYRKEKPVGYIVLRGQNLIDIGYSDNSALEQLLNFAIIYFRENKVLMVHAYLSLDIDGSIILRKKGFIKFNILQNKFTTRFVYPPQPATVKGKSDDEPFPRLDSWTFTMGDMDCKL